MLYSPGGGCGLFARLEDTNKVRGITKPGFSCNLGNGTFRRRKQMTGMCYPDLLVGIAWRNAQLHREMPLQLAAAYIQAFSNP